MAHILHLLPIRHLPQPHHQQIHIPLNHLRQIPRRRRRKSRPQQAPDPRMRHISPENNVVVAIVRVLDRVRELVFAVLHSAGLQAVDVLPCLWFGEG
jgi:hypothetical protein